MLVKPQHNSCCVAAVKECRVASVHLLCLIRKASQTSTLRIVLKQAHLGHQTEVKLITNSSTKSVW